jgi:hypothetical protein
MARPSFSGTHATRPWAGKIYRGSPRRLRRIRFRENTPPGLIILALVLLAAFILSVWLDLQHHAMHR